MSTKSEISKWAIFARISISVASLKIFLALIGSQEYDGVRIIGESTGYGLTAGLLFFYPTYLLLKTRREKKRNI